MRPNKAGFSLIELLLVVSFIPILSLAVFGNLTAGFKIWKTLDNDSLTEDLSVFYEKSEKDFGAALLFTGFPFLEEDGKVSFMTLIETDALLGGDRGIGQVTYAYDPSKKALVREQKNVSNLHREEQGQKSVVLRQVMSFKPFFLVYEKLDESYVWKESWEDPEGKRLPLAVRFQLAHLSSAGLSNITKTYKIPAGGE